MKRVLQIASAFALAGTIVPSAIYLGGGIELPVVKGWMLASTILWFATVPFWMGRGPDD